jgi:glycosyltransferase involved in cell wall biosynthesis
LALTDLAETCASAGFEVSVICSRYLYDHSGAALPAFEKRNGVAIHRVNQTNHGRKAHSGRLKDYASFFINAAILSFRLQPQMVVTLTTPPMLGILGWFHKLFRNAAFVYWSMDLHPEAEIAAGLLKLGHPLTSFIKKWHEKVLHSADKIVALSPNMKKRFSAYSVPEEKLRVISIWSDAHEIQPLNQKEAQFQLPEKWQSKCIIHYSGNLGLAHSFHSLLSIMEAAQSDSDFGFVFTGGGPQMPVLKQYVSQLGLKDVLFLPYVDRDKLSFSLAKAHIQWFSLDEPFEGIAYPSKLIGYMASGRPVVFLGAEHADSAQVIQSADCGKSFSLRESQSVLNYLTYLKNNAEERQRLGENARYYFDKHLTKDITTKQWLNLIQEVLDERPN